MYKQLQLQLVDNNGGPLNLSASSIAVVEPSSSSSSTPRQVDVLSRNQQERKKKLIELKKEIENDLVKLAKIRSEQEDVKKELEKKKKDLEDKLNAHKEALLDLKKKRQNLRKKILDFAIKKRKYEIGIAKLEIDSMERNRAAEEDEPAHIIAPMVDSYKKQVCALEKAIADMEKEREAGKDAWKEREKNRLKIEQELDKVYTKLDEDPEKVLITGLQERIKTIGDVCATLAGISQELILAHGAHQVDNFMQQLQNVLLPVAARPTMKAEPTNEN